MPEGFRADVLIGYGDVFKDGDRRSLRYGYNNDFLAYFPLRGSKEGLLFVNHEYPDPFFLHGYKPDGSAKSPEDVQEEQDAVGNSIVHIRRRKNGTWKVVSPSDYNRRIYGDRPGLRFTGPLKGARGHRQRRPTARSGTARAGSPRGARRCRARRTSTATARTWRPGLDIGYGWHQFGGQPGDAEYEFKTFKKYGWVCEHDPYDPDHVGRKHTALGRFRHENTAFRQDGGRFVLYMGDDKANEGVYKFVSKRSFRKRDRVNNRKILEEGTLYIARWEPEGRRRVRHRGRRGPDLAPPRAPAAGRRCRRTLSTTPRPSCAPRSARPSTTPTTPPTAPRTWRWRPTARCSSR